MHAYVQFGNKLATYIAVQEGKFTCVKEVYGTVDMLVCNLNRLLMGHTTTVYIHTFDYSYVAT